MPCLFCRIIAKELPAKVLYEDDYVLAIADINPVAPVHILIMPKKHIARIDSPEAIDCTSALFSAVKQLVALHNLSDPGFRVVTNAGHAGGQSVDHLHLHLLGGRQLTWPPG
ncbi:MAG: HIT domain-containing protein [Firmicutes bacterium]|nr:HIT domain-containing protein [Dethiobacter sp.]MBS3889457.1 HIT domain-containing protein [Bacillota bacterium]MBS4054851.1 HIT domain-containing protein [Thermaerobacter sp.]